MTETRRFTVTLTDEELLERGHELGDRLIDYGEVEGEQKEAAASYREQLKALRKRIDALAQAIATKQEMRDVVCEWVRKGDLMHLIRTDTHEIVGSRVLTEDERQEPLFRSN